MDIYLNDQVRPLTDNLTIDKLLTSELSISTNGLAVAVNEMVVPKSEWQNTSLQENDRVVLIQATQGG